jgi:hypothetical protein
MMPLRGQDDDWESILERLRPPIDSALLLIQRIYWFSASIHSEHLFIQSIYSFSASIHSAHLLIQRIYWFEAGIQASGKQVSGQVSNQARRRSPADAELNGMATVSLQVQVERSGDHQDWDHPLNQFDRSGKETEVRRS